jgi:DNA polymerase III subunit delta
MKPEKIIGDIKKGAFHPVYWLEGEEDFFIDKVTDYAEHHILTEAEAGFNRTILYGRDTDWATVINASRRYPMFAERQVVILKEAQAMRDIEKLEGYIDKPQPSTLLFIAYKGKKVDGRTKLAKILKDKAVQLTTRKLYENELPDWAMEQVQSRGYTITNKALMLLIDHIGNDLSRIANELDKLALNLKSRKSITEDDIEQFVGISKEYNVFELQDALARKDFYKAMRIATYFAHNPKSGPLQLIFPSLYGFFSKVLMLHAAGGAGDKQIAAAIGVSEWKIKEYHAAARKYNPQQLETAILLLNKYNLKSVGVDDSGTPDGELLKEFIAKLIS